MLKYLFILLFSTQAIAVDKITGKYILKLKIGSKVFDDILIVKKDPLTKKYIGSYEVPGSFKSELKSFNAKGKTFDFTIRVQEGSADYIAYFTGEFLSQVKIEGKAYIMPEKKLLGIYRGEKYE